MRLRIFVALAGALAALAAASTAGAAGFPNLQPGERTADLRERVPVNIVFVGLEPGQVRKSEFVAGLPDRYKPIVRSRLFYGVVEELGIDYRYDVDVTYAGASWENGFFAALSGLAAPADRTDFQEAYNEQVGTRDVGQNHFIDAPSVEKWLIDHAPPGVNTRENTIFFVNWWGRSDFIDHVYTKIGEPDPDTGHDFGLLNESRKIIGWGGTPPDDEETGLGSRGERRVWFFDLSAGPEAWGGNYDITNADLDGDEEPDYRIPVAWEYAPGGYRSPSALAGDLSLVARYAAINLLFTSSPLYPPDLTPELLPETVNLDLNTYEAWEGVDASATYQKPDYVKDELGELFPEFPLTSDTEDLKLRGEARQCYVTWLEDEPCFDDRPQYPAFGNLFLYHALNLDDFLDQKPKRSGKNRLYEAPAFNYATEDDLASGFLGYADDNYVDGTQSFIFSWVSPGVVESGYGLTTTQIHEYGHHFGMSHPHDGFDWETGIDYEPTGPLYFAWAADEHNSIMSYIDLNWDLSQFDRDNAARFQAAGFIANANVIAGDILRSKKADRAKALLAAADAAVGRAERAMAAHDYEKTWSDARAAYELALLGADRAGVDVEASHDGWAVLPRVKPGASGANAVVGYAAFDRIGPGTKRSLD
ncbi:MAG: hypothetical protein ACRDLZ_07620 [Gaiellaceae bacterium]